MPTLTVAQDDECPELEVRGRPSKASIRSLAERITCLEDSLRLLERIASQANPSTSAQRDRQPAAALDHGTEATVDLHDAIENAKERLGRHERFVEFAGSNWSFALAGVTSRHDRITDAYLDSGGIVRTRENRDQSVIPVVAFTPSLGMFCDGREDCQDRFGVGPLIVATPGVFETDKVPWMLGVGVMFSVRSDSKGSSVGIGLSYAFERMPLLREDFRIGSEAPSDGMGGWLEPVFVDRTTDSWMVVVAFSLGNSRTAGAE